VTIVSFPILKTGRLSLSERCLQGRIRMCGLGDDSFEPSALWHLGFIFAAGDLAAGTEVTVDYQLVIGSGEVMPFKDSATGREIVGLSWADNPRNGASALLTLLR